MKQRALWNPCTLAYAIVWAAPMATAQTADVIAPRPVAKAEVGKSDDHGSPKDDAESKSKKPTAKVLTVLVTGDGKPIGNAAVKIMSPPGIGAEPRTGSDGQVTFKVTTSGTVKVRVIAEGWETVVQEIVLAEDAQQLAFQLKQLPRPKAPSPPH